jgi:filamentous hemagglutinin family protein
MRATVFLGVLANGFLACAMLLPAIAQVTSDGTTNTTINSSGNNFTILNGIEKGNNLFHSFSNFSVPTSGSATFDLINTPNITTIFSRVTGGNVSNIDGLINTLNSNNAVSLFLMNPAGIVFGKNASLNIGGSFVGTTANSIKFASGVEFSATNPGAVPLLTMSVPIGLQMGHNSGAIKVNNTGHQLTGSSSAVLTNRVPSQVGLQVVPGQTLALVGGDLILDGGILTAPSGQIELGAIGQQTTSSQVGLEMIDGRWQLTADTVQPSGNLQFLGRSLVNASGTGQGKVQLWGGNLTMKDGSVIWLENRGNQAAGSIYLDLTNAINLIGTAPNTTLTSGIYADAKSTGSGSDILINTRQLTLQEGGNIQSRTFAAGDSGRVTVNASSIDFFDSISDRILGVIGTRSLQNGNGGDISINTQRLRINGGGAISASVGGRGNSGNILINASESVELSVFPSNFSDAIIGASAISASANAGDITINTARLSLEGGSLISSSVYGAGKGGTITVNAAESVTLSGSRFSPSRLTLEGSTIRTAGVLLPASVRASSINLPDQVTGPAGNIAINTPKLQVTDRAEAAVRHDSVGHGGRLEINADAVMLDRDGRLTATTASGQGGDINIQSNLLSLRHGSTITTTAGGTGGGGNITINSPIMLGLENSDIIANAVKGSGGNINITTQGIIGLKFRDTLTPRIDLTNDITASSQFNVNGMVQINNIGIDLNSGLVELPENITDSSQQIAAGCSNTNGSSLVATGRGGISQNPNQQVTSDVYDGLGLRTWSDIRDISAYRQSRTVTAQIHESPEVLVQATSWKRNAQGKIELVADKSPVNIQPSLTCAGVSNSSQP